MVTRRSSAWYTNTFPPQPPQAGRLWAGSTKCIYAVGEEVVFHVQSPVAVPATYRISEDTRVAPLKEGKVNLLPNTPSPVKVTLNHPGFLPLAWFAVEIVRLN